MKVCTCLLLFTIFAYTHTLTEETPTEDDKRGRVSLETVLEFSEKYNSGQDNLHNVHNLMPRGKKLFGNNKNERRDTSALKVKTFTGFLQEVINIINGYEDDAYEDFFNVLDEEIRKYHYRGCKFYEITENYETRRQLAAKLELIKGKPIDVTKANINLLADMIRDENYTKNVKEFVDYINSLYRQDGEQKFQKILSALESYSVLKSQRSNNNLVKIVKDAVRSVIFDHYTDLNANARRELKVKIETFWKQFKKDPITSPKTNFIPYTVAIVDSKNKINENITTKAYETDITVIAEYLPSTVRGREENILREEHTRTDKSNEDSDQNKESSQETSKKESNEHIDDSKINVLSTYLSSDKFPSGESFDSSSNSIEFSQERQREYNTQRYMTLYPEAITYRPQKITKDPDIVQRAGKVRTRTTWQSVQRMWVEESTGGIPRYILNRYTTKAMPKHKKTPETSDDSDESKVWSKLKTKHGKETKSRKHQTKHHRIPVKHHNLRDTKRQSKHKLKPKKKKILKRLKHKNHKHLKHRSVKPVRTSTTMKHTYKKQVYNHHKPIVVHSTKMNMYGDYKRVFDEVRNGMYVYSREDVSDSQSASITPEEVWLPRLSHAPKQPAAPKYVPPRIIKLRAEMRPRPSTTLAPQIPPIMSRMRYSNHYELWDEHNYGDLRKSAAPPVGSNEGLSIEEFKRDREREYREKSLRKSSGNDTIGIGLIDPNIIRRLHNLERELDAVKTRMNSSGDNVTNKLAAAKDKKDPNFTKDKDINEDVNVKLVNEDNFINFKLGTNKNFAKLYDDIVNKLHKLSTTSKNTTKTNKMITNTATAATTTIKTTTQAKADTKPKKKEPLADTVPLTASKINKTLKKDANITTANVKKNLTNKTLSNNDIRTTFNATHLTKELNKGITSNNVTSSVNNTNSMKVASVVSSSITSKSRRMLPYSPKPLKKAFNLGNPSKSKNVW